jgi:hypothetical protein
MKAYRDENGKVTLFRPDMNMKRMKRSAERIALPVRLFHSDLFLGSLSTSEAKLTWANVNRDSMEKRWLN